MDGTGQVTVCPEAEVADTFVSRLVGLLGRRGIGEDAGLLIRPCSGVHTLGMSFPIDVVSLDSKNRVLGVRESMPPWRIGRVGLRTRSVLELAPGRIRGCGIEVGHQLVIQPAP